MTRLIFPIFSLVIFTPTLGVFCSAQQLAVSDIDVTSARPLYDAILRVQSAFHSPVNFEEAPTSYRPALIQGRGPILAGKNLFPRGGTLRVSLKAENSVFDTVSAFASASVKSGFPGNYKVVQESDSVSVLPIGTVDQNGKSAEVSPVFNQRISLAESDRTFAESVSEVANALSTGGNRKVLIFSQPNLTRTRMLTTASNEPALQVLRRLSQQFSRSSFQLIYNASDEAYYLTVTIVEPIAQDEIKANKSTPPAANPFFIKQN